VFGTLASGVMVFSYTHFDNVFTTIVLRSVMTAVVPHHTGRAPRSP
jgi:hypothetical protein